VTANSTAYGLIGHLQRRLDQVKSEVEVGSQLALVRSSLLASLGDLLTPSAQPFSQLPDESRLRLTQAVEQATVTLGEVGCST